MRVSIHYKLLLLDIATTTILYSCYLLLPLYCHSFTFQKYPIIHNEQHSHSSQETYYNKRYLPTKVQASKSSSSTTTKTFNNNYPRIRKKLNGRIPILSRTIPLNLSTMIQNVTIWELEKPSELIELWWSSTSTTDSISTPPLYSTCSSSSIYSPISKQKIGDPFGVVMWPGSILASRELQKYENQVKDKTVLVLGAGTGVEVQVAAMLGARKVIATDVSKLTLKLLQYGVDMAGLGDIVDCKYFDLFSNEPLPDCDILVAADVLYNEKLAMQIGKRCQEFLKSTLTTTTNDDDTETIVATSPGDKNNNNHKDNKSKQQKLLIVTDSQRFHGTDFLDSIKNDDILQLQNNYNTENDHDDNVFVWKEVVLQDVTSSGVVISEDQTYNVTARILSLGWS